MAIQFIGATTATITLTTSVQYPFIYATPDWQPGDLTLLQIVGWSKNYIDQSAIAAYWPQWTLLTSDADQTIYYTTQTNQICAQTYISGSGANVVINMATYRGVSSATFIGSYAPSGLGTVAAPVNVSWNSGASTTGPYNVVVCLGEADMLNSSGNASIASFRATGAITTTRITSTNLVTGTGGYKFATSGGIWDVVKPTASVIGNQTISFTTSGVGPYYNVEAGIAEVELTRDYAPQSIEDDSDAIASDSCDANVSSCNEESEVTSTADDYRAGFYVNVVENEAPIPSDPSDARFSINLGESESQSVDDTHCWDILHSGHWVRNTSYADIGLMTTVTVTITVPTLVGYGTAVFKNDAGTLTLGMPAGIQSGDILIVAMNVNGGASSTTPAAPSGWTQKGWVVNNQLSMYWKRTDGTDTNVTFSTAINSRCLGFVVAYRNCIASGDPFDVVGTCANVSGSSNATAPSITTTTANNKTIALGMGVSFSGSSAALSATSGPALNLVSQQINYWAGAAYLYGVGVWDVTSATPGATGAEVINWSGGATNVFTGAQLFSLLGSTFTSAAIAPSNFVASDSFGSINKAVSIETESIQPLDNVDKAATLAGRLPTADYATPSDANLYTMRLNAGGARASETQVLVDSLDARVKSRNIENDVSSIGTISYVGSGATALSHRSAVEVYAPIGILPGDVLFLVIDTLYDQNQTGVYPSIEGTWSTLAGFGNCAAIFWKYAEGTETSFTLDGTNGSYASAFTFAYRNCSPVNAVGSYNYSQVGGSTTSLTTMTPQIPGSTLVMIGGGLVQDPSLIWNNPVVGPIPTTLRNSTYSSFIGSYQTSMALWDTVQTVPGATGSPTISYSDATSVTLFGQFIALSPVYSYVEEDDTAGLMISAKEVESTYLTPVVLPAPRPSFVAAGAVVNTYAATTLSVPLPAGIQTGDLLIIQANNIGAGQTTPVPVAPGWTLLNSYAACLDAFWYKIAVLPEQPVTLQTTTPNCSFSAVMVAYRGVDQNNPIDVYHDYEAECGANSQVSSTVTPNYANDTLLYFAYYWTSGTVSAFVSLTGATPTQRAIANIHDTWGYTGTAIYEGAGPTKPGIASGTTTVNINGTAANNCIAGMMVALKGATVADILVGNVSFGTKDDGTMYATPIDGNQSKNHVSVSESEDNDTYDSFDVGVRVKAQEIETENINLTTIPTLVGWGVTAYSEGPTITVQVPTDLQVGDLLLLPWFNFGPQLVPPTGWTAAGANLYWDLYDGTQTSVTLTGGSPGASGASAANIIAYRGADQNNPIDVQATSFGTNVLSLIIPSVTTRNANERILDVGLFFNIYTDPVWNGGPITYSSSIYPLTGTFANWSEGFAFCDSTKPVAGATGTTTLTTATNSANFYGWKYAINPATGDDYSVGFWSARTELDTYTYALDSDVQRGGINLGRMGILEAYTPVDNCDSKLKSANRENDITTPNSITYIGNSPPTIWQSNVATIQVPDNVQAGDVLIFVASCIVVNGYPPTISGAWNTIYGGPYIGAYWKYHDGIDTSFTVNGVGYYGTGVIEAYRGCDPINPIGATLSAGNAALSTYTIGSITPYDGQSTVIAVGVSVSQSQAMSWLPPTGLATNLRDQTLANVYAQYWDSISIWDAPQYIQGATGTETLSWTAGTYDNLAGLLFSLSPVSSYPDEDEDMGLFLGKKALETYTFAAQDLPLKNISFGTVYGDGVLNATPIDGQTLKLKSGDEFVDSVSPQDGNEAKYKSTNAELEYVSPQESATYEYYGVSGHDLVARDIIESEAILQDSNNAKFKITAAEIEYPTPQEDCDFSYSSANKEAESTQLSISPLPYFVGAGPLVFTYTALGGVTPSIPSGTLAGDLMLLVTFTSNYNGAGLTKPSADWTLVDPSGYREWTLYYKFATGSDTSPTVYGVSNNNGAAYIATYRNVDNTTPFDSYASAGGAFNASTTYTSDPYTLPVSLLSNYFFSISISGSATTQRFAQGDPNSFTQYVLDGPFAYSTKTNTETVTVGGNGAINIFSFSLNAKNPFTVDSNTLGLITQKEESEAAIPQEVQTGRYGTNNSQSETYVVAQDIYATGNRPPGTFADSTQPLDSFDVGIAFAGKESDSGQPADTYAKSNNPNRDLQDYVTPQDSNNLKFRAGISYDDGPIPQEDLDLGLKVNGKELEPVAPLFYFQGITPTEFPPEINNFYTYTSTLSGPYGSPLAPDGTATAYSVGTPLGTGPNAFYLLGPSPTYVTGNQYEIGFWAKYGGGTQPVVYTCTDKVNVFFDVSTGLVNNTYQPLVPGVDYDTISMTQLGSTGWYYCYCKFTARQTYTNATFGQLIWGLTNNTGYSTSGDLIYIWKGTVALPGSSINTPQDDVDYLLVSPREEQDTLVVSGDNQTLKLNSGSPELEVLFPQEDVDAAFSIQAQEADAGDPEDAYSYDFLDSSGRGNSYSKDQSESVMASDSSKSSFRINLSEAEAVAAQDQEIIGSVKLTRQEVDLSSGMINLTATQALPSQIGSWVTSTATLSGPLGSPGAADGSPDAYSISTPIAAGPNTYYLTGTTQTYVVGNTYSFGFWALKGPGSSNYVWYSTDSAKLYFDLYNGVFYPNGAVQNTDYSTVSIIEYGDTGWYYCYGTFKARVTSKQEQWGIYNGTAYSQAGDTIYVWNDTDRSLAQTGSGLFGRIYGNSTPLDAQVSMFGINAEESETLTPSDSIPATTISYTVAYQDSVTAQDSSNSRLKSANQELDYLEAGQDNDDQDARFKVRAAESESESLGKTPPTFVNTGAFTATPSTLIQVPIPAETQAGDALIFYFYGGYYPPTLSGWNQFCVNTINNGNNSAIYWKIALGSGLDIYPIIGDGVNFATAMIVAYRNCNPVNPIDSYGIGGNTSTTSASIAGVRTLSSNTLPIVIATNNTSGTPAGFNTPTGACTTQRAFGSGLAGNTIGQVLWEGSVQPSAGFTNAGETITATALSYSVSGILINLASSGGIDSEDSELVTIGQKIETQIVSDESQKSNFSITQSIKEIILGASDTGSWDYLSGSHTGNVYNRNQSDSIQLIDVNGQSQFVLTEISESIIPQDLAAGSPSFIMDEVESVAGFDDIYTGQSITATQVETEIPLDFDQGGRAYLASEQDLDVVAIELESDAEQVGTAEIETQVITPDEESDSYQISTNLSEQVEALDSQYVSIISGADYSQEDSLYPDDSQDVGQTYNGEQLDGDLQASDEEDLLSSNGVDQLEGDTTPVDDQIAGVLNASDLSQEDDLYADESQDGGVLNGSDQSIEDNITLSDEQDLGLGLGSQIDEEVYPDELHDSNIDINCETLEGDLYADDSQYAGIAQGSDNSQENSLYTDDQQDLGLNVGSETQESSISTDDQQELGLDLGSEIQEWDLYTVESQDNGTLIGYGISQEEIAQSEDSQDSGVTPGSDNSQEDTLYADDQQELGLDLGSDTQEEAPYASDAQELTIISSSEYQDYDIYAGESQEAGLAQGSDNSQEEVLYTDDQHDLGLGLGSDIQEVDVYTSEQQDLILYIATEESESDQILESQDSNYTITADESNSVEGVDLEIESEDCTTNISEKLTTYAQEEVSASISSEESDDLEPVDGQDFTLTVIGELFESGQGSDLEEINQILAGELDESATGETQEGVALALTRAELEYETISDEQEDAYFDITAESSDYAQGSDLEDSILSATVEISEQAEASSEETTNKTLWASESDDWQPSDEITVGNTIGLDDSAYTSADESEDSIYSIPASLYETAEGSDEGTGSVVATSDINESTLGYGEEDTALNLGSDNSQEESPYLDDSQESGLIQGSDNAQNDDLQSSELQDSIQVSSLDTQDQVPYADDVQDFATIIGLDSSQELYADESQIGAIPHAVELPESTEAQDSQDLLVYASDDESESTEAQESQDVSYVITAEQSEFIVGVDEEVDSEYCTTNILEYVITKDELESGSFINSVLSDSLEASDEVGASVAFAEDLYDSEEAQDSETLELNLGSSELDLNEVSPEDYEVEGLDLSVSILDYQETNDSYASLPSLELTESESAEPSDLGEASVQTTSAQADDTQGDDFEQAVGEFAGELSESVEGVDQQDAYESLSGELSESGQGSDPQDASYLSANELNEQAQVEDSCSASVLATAELSEQEEGSSQETTGLTISEVAEEAIQPLDEQELQLVLTSSEAELWQGEYSEDSSYDITAEESNHLISAELETESEDVNSNINESSKPEDEQDASHSIALGLEEQAQGLDFSDSATEITLDVVEYATSSDDQDLLLEIRSDLEEYVSGQDIQDLGNVLLADESESVQPEDNQEQLYSLSLDQSESVSGQDNQDPSITIAQDISESVSGQDSQETVASLSLDTSDSAMGVDEQNSSETVHGALEGSQETSAEQDQTLALGSEQSESPVPSDDQEYLLLQIFYDEASETISGSDEQNCALIAHVEVSESQESDDQQDLGLQLSSDMQEATEPEDYESACNLIVSIEYEDIGVVADEEIESETCTTNMSERLHSSESEDSQYSITAEEFEELTWLDPQDSANTLDQSIEEYFTGSDDQNLEITLQSSLADYVEPSDETDCTLHVASEIAEVQVADDSQDYILSSLIEEEEFVSGYENQDSNIGVSTYSSESQGTYDNEDSSGIVPVELYEEEVTLDDQSVTNSVTADYIDSQISEDSLDSIESLSASTSDHATCHDDQVSAIVTPSEELESQEFNESSDIAMLLGLDLEESEEATEYSIETTSLMSEEYEVIVNPADDEVNAEDCTTNINEFSNPAEGQDSRFQVLNSQEESQLADDNQEIGLGVGTETLESSDQASDESVIVIGSGATDVGTPHAAPYESEATQIAIGSEDYNDSATALDYQTDGIHYGANSGSDQIENPITQDIYDTAIKLGSASVLEQYTVVSDNFDRGLNISAFMADYQGSASSGDGFGTGFQTDAFQVGIVSVAGSQVQPADAEISTIDLGAQPVNGHYIYSRNLSEYTAPSETEQLKLLISGLYSDSISDLADLVSNTYVLSTNSLETAQPKDDGDHKLNIVAEESDSVQPSDDQDIGILSGSDYSQMEFVQAPDESLELGLNLSAYNLDSTQPQDDEDMSLAVGSDQTEGDLQSSDSQESIFQVYVLSESVQAAEDISDLSLNVFSEEEDSDAQGSDQDNANVILTSDIDENVQGSESEDAQAAYTADTSEYGQALESEEVNNILSSDLSEEASGYDNQDLVIYLLVTQSDDILGYESADAQVAVSLDISESVSGYENETQAIEGGAQSEYAQGSDEQDCILLMVSVDESESAEPSDALDITLLVGTEELEQALAADQEVDSINIESAESYDIWEASDLEQASAIYSDSVSEYELGYDEDDSGLVLGTELSESSIGSDLSDVTSIITSETSEYVSPDDQGDSSLDSNNDQIDSLQVSDLESAAGLLQPADSEEDITSDDNYDTVENLAASEIESLESTDEQDNIGNLVAESLEYLAGSDDQDADFNITASLDESVNPSDESDCALILELDITEDADPMDLESESEDLTTNLKDFSTPSDENDSSLDSSNEEVDELLGSDLEAAGLMQPALDEEDYNTTYDNSDLGLNPGVSEIDSLEGSEAQDSSGIFVTQAVDYSEGSDEQNSNFSIQVSVDESSSPSDESDCALGLVLEQYENISAAEDESDKTESFSAVISDSSASSEEQDCLYSISAQTSDAPEGVDYEYSGISRTHDEAEYTEAVDEQNCTIRTPVYYVDSGSSADDSDLGLNVSCSDSESPRALDVNELGLNLSVEEQEQAQGSDTEIGAIPIAENISEFSEPSDISDAAPSITSVESDDQVADDSYLSAYSGVLTHSESLDAADDQTLSLDSFSEESETCIGSDDCTMSLDLGTGYQASQISVDSEETTMVFRNGYKTGSITLSLFDAGSMFDRDISDQVFSYDDCDSIQPLGATELESLTPSDSQNQSSQNGNNSTESVNASDGSIAGVVINPRISESCISTDGNDVIERIASRLSESAVASDRYVVGIAFGRTSSERSVPTDLMTQRARMVAGYIDSPVAYEESGIFGMAPGTQVEYITPDDSQGSTVSTVNHSVEVLDPSEGQHSGVSHNVFGSEYFDGSDESEGKLGVAHIAVNMQSSSIFSEDLSVVASISGNDISTGNVNTLMGTGILLNIDMSSVSSMTNKIISRQRHEDDISYISDATQDNNNYTYFYIFCGFDGISTLPSNKRLMYKKYDSLGLRFMIDIDQYLDMAGLGSVVDAILTTPSGLVNITDLNVNVIDAEHHSMMISMPAYILTNLQKGAYTLDLGITDPTGTRRSLYRGPVIII
jgi:hypothetical protein